jgi:hypothetical protein
VARAAAGCTLAKAHRAGEGLLFTRVLADRIDLRNGHPEVLQKRPMLFREARLEAGMQRGFLGIGHACFVEERDELIFGDGLHGMDLISPPREPSRPA